MPIRRSRAVCVHYTSYKPDLQEDFHFRCGYCNSSDKIKTRSFTIDHFIPQTPVGFSHNILPNHYPNLVYSCAHCNSAKTNKWPTKNSSVHNNGIEGFVDPADRTYDDLFHRNNQGQIIPKDPSNALAIYIKRELKLWRGTHALLWKLELLDKQIKILKIYHAATPNDTIKTILFELLYQYHEVMGQFFEV